ncbi:MAG: hypothetical protein H0U71_07630 [Gammaproteobacteria bacterium]|nr:hypothetical protein [Gammaproteobacteria bacterium]
MAKTNGSKTEVKKLQKEIMVLRNKLKAADKKSIASEKNWEKKHKAFNKEMMVRLESARGEGYQSGVSEFAKKAAARKKALHSAEMSFEKDYRSKGTKAKPAKKSGTKAKSKSAKSTAKSAKTTKSVKSASATKAAKNSKKAMSSKSSKAQRTTKSTKTTSARANAKRRGRPSKQSGSRGMEGQQLNHHNEMSSHHDSELN